MSESLESSFKDDWLCQREMADLLHISQRIASVWAADGKLRQYEHGFPQCGRRKYSRQLVERLIRRGWEEAIKRQDETLDEDDVEAE